MRTTPCSPQCANWLLYCIQPKNAHGKLQPAAARHAYTNAPRWDSAVDASWSLGNGPARHSPTTEPTTNAWVRQLLALTVDLDQADDDQAVNESASRYAWELARPDDPDVSPLGHRLLWAVSERIQFRGRLDEGRRRAGGLSATGRIDPGGGR